MKITNWLFHHTREFTLLVFVLVLIFFASSIPSVNVGYADSDEFLALAPHWGIAHPPGYSLYVGALHIAMSLPVPWTTPAFRAHFVTALASALAISLIVPLAKKLYLHLVPQKQLRPFIYCLAVTTTVLSLATNQQVWLYSQITEKYLFAAPLVIGFIILSLSIMTAKKPSPLSFLLFSGLFGLSIGHHQSLIFLFPIWLLTLILSSIGHRPALKNIGLSFLGLFLGLGLSLFLLWIQVSRQSALPLSWYSGDGLPGVFNLLTRQDFQGEIYITGVTSNGYLPSRLKLSQLYTNSLRYLTQLTQSFGWGIFLPLMAAALGLIHKKNRPLLILFLPFLLLGPALAAYLGWPEDIGSQAITQRFYLVGYFTLLPLLFIGFVTLFTRIQLALQILSPHQPLITGLLLIVPLWLMWQAIRLYPDISLKKFNLVSRLYQGILTQVKPDSVITCYSDTSCFALLYEQSVNQLRPDVQIVPLAHPLVHNQLETNRLQKFTYPDNPFKLFDIVTHTIGRRPVYAVDMNQYYSNLFGIRNGFMYYIPSGFHAELTRTMPVEIDVHPDSLVSDYLNAPAPKFDLYRQFLTESLAQTHISNAYIHLKRGERPQAQNLLNTATGLANRLLPQLTDRTQGARLEIEQTLPDPNFAPGSQVIDSDKLLQDVSEYLRLGRNGVAYTALLGAISINPESVPARLELAKIYQGVGDYQFAKLEFQHVLMLDPNNQTALDQLQQLP